MNLFNKKKRKPQAPSFDDALHYAKVEMDEAKRELSEAKKRVMDLLYKGRKQYNKENNLK